MGGPYRSNEPRSLRREQGGNDFADESDGRGLRALLNPRDRNLSGWCLDADARTVVRGTNPPF